MYCKIIRREVVGERGGMNKRRADTRKLCPHPGEVIPSAPQKPWEPGNGRRQKAPGKKWGPRIGRGARSTSEVGGQWGKKGNRGGGVGVGNLGKGGHQAWVTLGSRAPILGEVWKGEIRVDARERDSWERLERRIRGATNEGSRGGGRTERPSGRP